jgi:hypothetical protein
VFINIVNCDDDYDDDYDDDDDDDDGSDGVSIKGVRRDAFYPFCSHIIYKKYRITVRAKLR